MRPSDALVEFVARQEGFRAEAYKPLPTDRYTIGYGLTFYSNGQPVEKGDSITEIAAKSELEVVLIQVAKDLGEVDCSQQQFDAVLSLCYNIGVPLFKRSATGKLFSAGANISNRFGLYVLSGGKQIEGLVNRRRKERAIYESGNYFAE